MAGGASGAELHSSGDARESDAIRAKTVLRWEEEDVAGLHVPNERFGEFGLHWVLASRMSVPPLCHQSQCKALTTSIGDLQRYSAGFREFILIAQIGACLCKAPGRDYGSGGWEFESLRARHYFKDLAGNGWALFL